MYVLLFLFLVFLFLGFLFYLFYYFFYFNCGSLFYHHFLIFLGLGATCGLLLTVNTFRYNSSKREIACSKHVGEGPRSKSKEEEEKRRKENEEYENALEKKANDGGWRDCIGGIRVHYPVSIVFFYISIFLVFFL